MVFSIVFTLSARHSAGFLLSVYGKVRFVVNKEMINTRGRDEPSPSSLRDATSPEGGGFGDLPVSTDKAPPSGELAATIGSRLRGCLRLDLAMPERVSSPFLRKKSQDLARQAG